MRLLHAKVVKITICSRESSQNDDFLSRMSSKLRLLHANVVKMTTFSRESRQNDDFCARKSSKWRLFGMVVTHHDPPTHSAAFRTPDAMIFQLLLYVECAIATTHPPTPCAVRLEKNEFEPFTVIVFGAAECPLPTTYPPTLPCVRGKIKKKTET